MYKRDNERTITFAQLMGLLDEPNLSDNGIDIIVSDLWNENSCVDNLKSIISLKNRGHIVLGIGKLSSLSLGVDGVSASLKRAEHFVKVADGCLIFNEERFLSHKRMNPDNKRINADIVIFDIEQGLRDILKEGNPNIDSDTLKDSLIDCGTFAVTRGIGKGVDRVVTAFQEAYKVPVYFNFHPDSALKIIIKVLVPAQSPLSDNESSELRKLISNLPKRRDVVVGVGNKKLKDDEIEIVMLRTGVNTCF